MFQLPTQPQSFGLWLINSFKLCKASWRAVFITVALFSLLFVLFLVVEGTMFVKLTTLTHASLGDKITQLNTTDTVSVLLLALTMLLLGVIFIWGSLVF